MIYLIIRNSVGIPTDNAVTDSSQKAGVIALLKGILAKTGETIINAESINLNTDDLETLLTGISEKIEQITGGEDTAIVFKGTKYIIF